MKKLTQFAIISAGTLILALILSACPNKWDRASKIILETLEEQYGEEFVIEKMGGSWGTSDDSTIKAYVHPVSDKTKQFQAQIKKKGLSEVTDGYMSILVAEKLENELSILFKNIYPELFIDVMATDIPTSEGSQLFDLKTYIHDRPYLSYVVTVLIKADEESFDKEQEAENVAKLIDLYNKLEYKTVAIDIYYLKDSEFEESVRKFNDLDNIYEFYRDRQRTINYVELDKEIVDENRVSDIIKQFGN